MIENSIKTVRNGNNIAKICIEDITKLMDKVESPFKSARYKVEEILDEYYPNTWDDETDIPIVKGVGVAKLMEGDIFDEEIGNDIAFRKAKLSANIKKLHLIEKVMNLYGKALDQISEEGDRLAQYIINDVEALRKYNPEFKVNI